MADLGAPYSILLYERFLGRPFAAHRDSVSELVGSLGVRPHSVAREGIPGNPAAMLRRRRCRRRPAIHQPAGSGPASASWQRLAPGPPVA